MQGRPVGAGAVGGNAFPAWGCAAPPPRAILGRPVWGGKKPRPGTPVPWFPDSCAGEFPMLGGSILNRMIFWELVKVFLLSLASLTGLFLMAGLIQQASQLGLSMAQVHRRHPAVSCEYAAVHDPRHDPVRLVRRVRPRLAHDNEVGRGQGGRGSPRQHPEGRPCSSGRSPPRAPPRCTTPSSRSPSSSFRSRFSTTPEEVLYNVLRRERCFRHRTSPT